MLPLKERKDNVYTRERFTQIRVNASSGLKVHHFHRFDGDMGTIKKLV